MTERVLQTLAEWQLYPEIFVEEAMGWDGRQGFQLTEQQQELFVAVGQLTRAKLKYKDVIDGRAPKSILTDEDWALIRKQGISVMSGKGTGKGAAAALLIFWFLYMFDRCKSPITGPSFEQIRKGLLAECSKWLKMKRPQTGEYLTPLHDAIVIQRDIIYLKSEGNKSRFFAIRTASPDADEDQQKGVLDGWHEDAMMIVVDEAASTANGIFTSFVTTVTRPLNFVVMFFNPTKNSGFAYETHFSQRKESWIQIHWDSRKSPLVTPAQLEIMEKDYGEDGPEYRINVLGLPPKNDKSALISLDWIVSAEERWEADSDSTWEGYPIIAALDPANSQSTESGFVVRQGNRVLLSEGVKIVDSTLLGDYALLKIAEYEIDVLYVDSVGLGGPILDYVRKMAQATSCLVRAADVRRAAKNKRFFRARDEKWWEVRMSLKDGLLQLPKDSILRNELASIRLVDPADQGEMKVESKKQMRARGMPSPNRGDALMMTNFYRGTAKLRGKQKPDDYEENDPRFLRSKLTWMGI